MAHPGRSGSTTLRSNRSGFQRQVKSGQINVRSNQVKSSNQVRFNGPGPGFHLQDPAAFDLIPRSYDGGAPSGEGTGQVRGGMVPMVSVVSSGPLRSSGVPKQTHPNSPLLRKPLFSLRFSQVSLLKTGGGPRVRFNGPDVAPPRVPMVSVVSCPGHLDKRTGPSGPNGPNTGRNSLHPPPIFPCPPF